jgi:hypothetical protein
MKFLSKNVFFCICFNNECIIIYKRENPLPYQRGEDFINGHCIIFKKIFCLVMFHKPQTLGPMVVGKL